MITVTKTITTTVLLSLLLSTTGNAEARLKYYRYNAEIPMVETTLNMMVAMGVIEQIPGHLVHDGNPYNRLVNTQYGGGYARSPYALPVNTGYYNALVYDRYRGLSPYSSAYYSGIYGYPYGYGGGSRSWDYPWGGSQWASDPWSSPQWSNPWNTTWGNPQWTYPPSTYSQWNSPWSTTWGDPWNSAYYGGQLNSPWSSLWGNRLNSPWYGSANYPWGGTANSPWSSPLSNTLVNPFATPLPGAGYGTATPGYPGNVVSPGYAPGNTALYNYGTPGNVAPPGNTPGYNPGNVAPPVNTPGYNPGNVAPSGSMPGYNPGNVAPPVSTPGYNPGNVAPPGSIPGYYPGNVAPPGSTPGYYPGNVAPPGSTPGYYPGNTSLYTQGNSGTPSFSGDRRSTGAPAGFDTSRANSFSINNISFKSTADPERRSSLTKRNSVNGKFERRLDGLWIGDSGEMLGIRGRNFLWYDGKDRYANGSLRLTTNELKITRAGTRRELSMHYRMVGSTLYTVGRSGKVRTFQRTSLMQPSHSVNELYASPSKYQVDSASPQESNTVPKSTRADALKPYSGGMADLGAGSDSGFFDRKTDRTAAKPNRGEISPLWSPKAKSSAGRDSSNPEQMPANRANRSKADVGTKYGSRPPSKTTPSISAAVPVRSNSAQGAGTTWESEASGQFQNIWRQRAKKTFKKPDPSQYLYSYLKDKHRSLPSAAPPSPKNGNIWAPTASSNGYTTFASAPSSERRKTHSSNIWKPTPAFTKKRRNGEVLNVYYSDAMDLADAKELANANVTKFAWAE